MSKTCQQERGGTNFFKKNLNFYCLLKVVRNKGLQFAESSVEQQGVVGWRKKTGCFV